MPENRAFRRAPSHKDPPSAHIFYTWVVIAILLRRTFVVQVKPLDRRRPCFLALHNVLAPAIGFASLDHTHAGVAYTEWLRHMLKEISATDDLAMSVVEVFTRINPVVKCGGGFLNFVLDDTLARTTIIFLDPRMRDLVDAMADAFCNAYDPGHHANSGHCTGSPRQNALACR